MNDKLIYKDFDRERIDRGNLTLSTAAEALRCGLVTDADYSRFESEIFDELARLITKYTRGESDSVEGGTAAELLGSILYNTDLALSRLSPEAAAVVIFSVRLQNIYLEGLKNKPRIRSESALDAPQTEADENKRDVRLL